MTIQSFAPISEGNSKILILGTMPGNESIIKGQYYAHPNNHFWDIMFRVLINGYCCSKLVQETESYESKVNLLIKNRVALWDVLKYCERKGNLDKEIRNGIINDFETFFENNKRITSIFFNGKKAYQYFCDYNKHIAEKRNIGLVPLNSTSSTNPNNVFGILKEWKNAINNALEGDRKEVDY
jgi:hypoxanthine-DNA glycosylase